MQNTYPHLSIRVLLAIIAANLLFAANSNAQDTFDLNVKFPKGQQTRITSNYEHSGKVLVLPNNVKDKEIRKIGLQVEAKLSYVQRSMSKEQAVRYFENAKGKIKLADATTEPSLVNTNRLVIARLKKDGVQVEMASVQDTLQQSELKLIQNPADPLTLPAILNKAKVKQGDSWEPDTEALANFLAVRTIKQSDIKLKVKKLDNKTARIFILGSAVAKVDDVTTELEVSGIANVDRASQTLQSFKLGIRETKRPGQIAPGFDGNTKVDLRFTQIRDIQPLSNESLAKHTKGGKIRQRLKWVSRLAGFEMLFEPRWRMITESEDAALLRFIDVNELLTQCNVVVLPKHPPGRPLGLAEYKKEISRIIDADKNAKLVSSDQRRTQNGNAVLNVVISGNEQGVPVRWFYYNLSSPDGRQVAFVFTLAASVSSRVTSIADQLVNEFEFKAPVKQVARSRSNTKAKPVSSRKR